MKLRIFLLVLFSVAVSYFATDYLFIGQLRTQSENVAKGLASRAASLYRYIYRADSLYEIRAAEELAKKQELLDVFDSVRWEEAISENRKDIKAIEGDEAEVIKEIAMKVQIELNVINRMYDKNDAIFVIDSFGNVVAKNLDGLFGHKDLSAKTLFSAALKGVSDVDIISISGRIYRVVATPMYKDGKIVGAYCSGDLLNSESANEIALRLNEGHEPVIDGGRLHFGFFNKDRLIGSTLPTETHEGFRRYISQNRALFEKINQEGAYQDAFRIQISGENFFAKIAKHPTLSEESDVFYMTLISADKIISPVTASHRSMIITAALLIVLGLIAVLIMDEYFNRPVNRFMENMLEIINGNTRFRFDNDAEGVEGSLNQNANMMIASLLGEKVPEKDDGTKNN
jgi:methyl-accepting chemotaxis protein